MQFLHLVESSLETTSGDEETPSDEDETPSIKEGRQNNATASVIEGIGGSSGIEGIDGNVNNVGIEES